MRYGYKLVALDVDGTLLGANGALPEDNVNVIRQLHGNGVRFVIATGRNDFQVTRLAEELNIEPLIIGCNGASVRDLHRGISYMYLPIGDDPMERLMGLASDAGVSLRMYSLERYYLAFARQQALDAQKERRASTYAGLILGEGNAISVDSFEHFLTYQDQIIKAVIVDGDAEKILSIQKKILDIPGLAAFRYSSNCLDIVDSHVSKGNALKALGERLGIPREEIIAIGDGENDAHMLNYAGCGVAMGNGEEKLKEIADLVTETNREAGVARALERIFGLT